MDIVTWLGWSSSAIIRSLWALVWFLISGWVSTLLQIALLVAVIHFFKYGWQRAPIELWRRTYSLASFLWNWLRARAPQAAPGDMREVVRFIRTKEFGDINVSTLFSLLLLIGLVLLARL